MDYTSTDFGGDSSSRFSVRVRTNRQTNRQTRLNALPTPAAIQPAWAINDGRETTFVGVLWKRFVMFAVEHSD